nr:hypothetical protein HmN_000988600 [Hymenolepis microstoma]
MICSLVGGDGACANVRKAMQMISVVLELVLCPFRQSCEASNPAMDWDGSKQVVEVVEAGVYERCPPLTIENSS